VESGKSIVEVEVEVVAFDLELSVNMKEFDAAAEDKFITELSNELGIDKTLISVKATPTSSRRRGLQSGEIATPSANGGGVSLAVTIEVPEDQDAADTLETSSSGTSPADALANKLNSTFDTFTEMIGITMGFVVKATSGFKIETETREETKKCPLGFWCSAGLEVPCPENFYQPFFDKLFAGACLACPDNAESPENSTKRSQCECRASLTTTIGDTAITDQGFYDAAPEEDTVECLECPVGSDCTAKGSHLVGLHVKIGYYRVSNESIDLRQCPDFGGEESDATSDSPCVGGVYPDICREWTAGPYCQLCNVTLLEDPALKRSRFMQDGFCEPCEDNIQGNLLAMALIGLGIAAFIALYSYYRPDRKVQWLRTVIFWARIGYGRLSLRAKIKNALTFYQITTRIGTVYGVTMPEEVQWFLDQISFRINFSIDGFGIPLQCVGLQSFFNKLMFMMVWPFIVCLVVVIVSVLRVKLNGSVKGVRDALRDGALNALPICLGIQFLVFPSVSGLGFQGLETCEAWTTQDGEVTHSYLKADYSVDCLDMTPGSLGIASEYQSASPSPGSPSASTPLGSRRSTLSSYTVCARL
jgi:hypothetical protein